MADLSDLRASPERPREKRVAEGHPHRANIALNFMFVTLA